MCIPAHASPRCAPLSVHPGVSGSPCLSQEGKLRQRTAASAGERMQQGSCCHQAALSHTEPGIAAGSRRCGTNAAPAAPRELGCSGCGGLWTLPGSVCRAQGSIFSRRSAPPWPSPFLGGNSCRACPPRGAWGGCRAQSTPKPRLGGRTGVGRHPHPSLGAQPPPRSALRGWGCQTPSRGGGAGDAAPSSIPQLQRGGAQGPPSPERVVSGSPALFMFSSLFVPGKRWEREPILLRHDAG